MTAYVYNHSALAAWFSEGNEFAMTHFCDGNINAVYSRTVECKRTVYDLFDDIQSSIDNLQNVAVVYHETIGIPLGVSIDDTFTSVNCIYFEPDPDNPLSDDLVEFNDGDPYSCGNVPGKLQYSNFLRFYFVEFSEHFQCYSCQLMYC